VTRPLSERSSTISAPTRISTPARTAAANSFQGVAVRQRGGTAVAQPLDQGAGDPAQHEFEGARRTRTSVIRHVAVCRQV
jgi:hypothetical protein